MSTLREYYDSTVAPALVKKFGYKNVMQIPKLNKVVINVGCGADKDNTKVIEAIMNDLSAITGQRPVVCRSRKSIANFKLRDGQIIGVSANSFDGRGNYSTGIKEQLIFPEIEYDKIDKVRGMDINFITTANTDEEAKELLSLMGAPFAK